MKATEIKYGIGIGMIALTSQSAEEVVANMSNASRMVHVKSLVYEKYGYIHEILWIKTDEIISVRETTIKD